MKIKCWAALAAVAGLGILATLQAGGPRERKVTGRVDRVFTGAEKALVLVSEEGVALGILPLKYGCPVYLNNEKVTAEELRQGLIATIYFNDYAKVIYRVEAQTPPLILEGVIESSDFRDGIMRLVDFKIDFEFKTDTKILLDGKFAFSGELKPGQRAIIYSSAAERNGIVAKIDKDRNTIYFEGSREPLAYQDGWRLFEGRKPIFVLQVEKGLFLSARKNPFRALTIDAKSPRKPKAADIEKEMENEREKEKEKGEGK